MKSSALSRITALVLIMALLAVSLSAFSEGESEEEVIATYSSDIIDIDLSKEDFSDKGLRVNESLPEDVINILLIGIDTRNQELDKGLADVLMVLSLNTVTGDITLSSILRDSYMKYAKSGKSGRINAALNAGGYDELVATINNTYQMNIRRFILIKFSGVVGIVDALGGIDLNLTAAECKSINNRINLESVDFKLNGEPLEVRDGVQHCEGLQALNYARIRDLDNDFMRTSRQRALMNALFNRFSSHLDFDTVLSALDVVNEHIKTNLSLNEILDIVSRMLSTDMPKNAAREGFGFVSQITLPVDGGWYYEQVEGSSVIQLYTQKNALAFYQKVYCDSITFKDEGFSISLPYFWEKQEAGEGALARYYSESTKTGVTIIKEELESPLSFSRLTDDTSKAMNRVNQITKYAVPFVTYRDAEKRQCYATLLGKSGSAIYRFVFDGEITDDYAAKMLEFIASLELLQSETK
ncbi:MAG: LCP family protein [Eubacteriales bacterium]|nr:LCP family protein [Eubacteriales bacterium]MDD3881965.1 LCP family protein [Eubacteriales bacterium]MDD4513134.1 LCP family protein [Eubacteriales bacterium]